MYTKPLVQSSVVTSDLSKDLNSINRFLAAAAISPRFCASLLSDPGQAIRAGFGGEHFPLSKSAHKHVASVRASTLPDFVRKLDEKLSYRLHVS
jgi:hypothetical protein